MNWLKSFLLAGAVQALAVTLALAGQGLETIKTNGVFRIGTEGTYAPFTYHDPNGQLVGFDVEIGREIAKRLGVKPEFLEGKWDGLIAGLDANRYDAVINQVGITEQRKQKYDFSDPYIASKAVLIVRGDNDGIKGFADLQGQEVRAVANQQLRQARRGIGRIDWSARTVSTSRSSWCSTVAPTPRSTTACPSSTSRSTSRTRM